jgi:hypothetical protein
MNETTYTLHLEPSGAGLRVTIKELGIVLEVASSRREDAERAATRAISEYHLKQREAAQASA